MAQAQQLWKMLDDMADSDPDQYNTFIKKNITEGFEHLSTENKAKVETKKVLPEAGLLFTVRLALQEIAQSGLLVKA
jgi:hypothetical protein